MQETMIEAGRSLDGKCWFAVETRSRHEKKVATELQEKGIESFLPLSSEKRRWSDRRRLVLMPIFPRYVFVRIESSLSVRTPVLRTKGVISFVGNRGIGVPIPYVQIENLRNIFTQAVPYIPHAFLDVGQRVRIRGGCLEGVEGILAAVNGDKSLVVSVKLIRKSLAIRIEGYRVERVPSSECSSRMDESSAGHGSSLAAPTT
jgi:transcriptional antiterminator NusG